MRSLFRSFYTSAQDVLGRVGAWTKRHASILVALLVVSTFFLPPLAHAGFFSWLVEGTAANAFNLIVWIVSALVQFMGKIFVFLVDIFLGFARYNDFANAYPVKVGWVIVRDICNMFFIVILLLSAFSTIIGWDSSLRYNQVLPKLLLMAILINFSRTLIQVLIDFSQVVMLTFVNAFRSAGAGNFTSAFRVDRLLSMRDDFNQSQQNLQSLDEGNYDLAVQVFTSFLLALVLIVIANGVMVIMIAYVLARIIGLWVALIFSPAAFFVTAVPGRIAGGLSSFGSKYWSRLAGMLTGGPVVMFFIYLTFAILQQQPPSPPPAPSGGTPPQGGATTPAAPQAASGLAGHLQYAPSPELQASGATGFLTRVGTSEDVASFIVAVALMLMALEAAVEAANAVDSSVGAFAGKVGSASKGLAFGAAALAASAPWLAAKFGYRTVDKRYDITGKASGLGLRVANKIPIAGQYLRKPLMAGMTMRKREAASEAQELLSATSGMTADQKRIVQGGFRSVVGSTVGNLSDQVLGEGVRKKIGGAWYSQGDQQAAALLAKDLASEATMGEDQRNLEGAIEASIKNDARFANLSGDDKEKLAEYMAADTNLQRRRQQFAELKQQAERTNDHELLDYIKAEQKKDPRLHESESKRQEKAQKAGQDPTKFKNLSADAVSDTYMLSQAMLGAGIAKVNANGVLQLEDDPAKREAFLDAVKAQNKLAGENLDYWIDQIENNTAANGDKGMEMAKATRARVELDDNGNRRTYVNPEVSKDLSSHVATVLSPLTGKPTFGQADPLGTVFGIRDRDRIADSVKGGITLRNSRESSAMNDLKGFSTAGQMGTSQAVAALRNYLDAKGNPLDLANLPEFEKTVKAFIEEQVTKMSAPGLISGDLATGFTVTNAAEFNKHLKPITRLFGQLGKPGVSKAYEEQLLEALKAGTGQINVAGAAPGAPATPYFMTDILADKKVWAVLSKSMRENTLSVVESAQRLEKYTDSLLRGPMTRMADPTQVKRMASPVVRQLENPPDKTSST